jgi:dihydrofolate reductase
MTIISMVAAMTRDRVIGVNNQLPWHIPEELKHFKAVTMGKPMIMGRKTFDAIGRRLLPGRQTIVLTRDKNLNGEGFIVVPTVPAAIAAAGKVPEIMVVGGAGVYAEFLPLAQRLYLSIIDQELKGDAFFPDFNQQEWILCSETKHQSFSVKVFERLALNSSMEKRNETVR